MSFEKAGVITAFAVVVFGVGVGWSNLNSKVEKIDAALEKLAADAADDLCLSIVSRQVAAIEREKKDISQQLEKLAEARGCYKRFDEIVAAGGVRHPSLDAMVNADDSTAAATEAMAASEEKDARELEAKLLRIDRELQLNQDAGG